MGIALETTDLSAIAIGDTEIAAVSLDNVDLWSSAVEPEPEFEDTTVFLENGISPTYNNDSSGDFEVGIAFTCDVDTEIVGARIYSRNLDTHSRAQRTAKIWDMNGFTLEHQQELPDVMINGWYIYSFDTPFVAQAGVSYVISYDFGPGTLYYTGAGDIVGLDAEGVTYGVLGDSGRYSLTPDSAPNQTSGAGDYGIEPVFQKEVTSQVLPTYVYPTYDGPPTLNPDTDINSPNEIGVMFFPAKDIDIHGVSIWNQGEVARAGRTAKLWDRVEENAVATIALPDALPAGYSEHFFASPVSVKAGGEYIVSYDIGGSGNDGLYADTGTLLQGFGDGSVYCGHMLSNRPPGVYNATPNTKPTNGQQKNNYGCMPLYLSADMETPVPEVVALVPSTYLPGLNQVENRANVPFRFRSDCTIAEYRIDGGAWQPIGFIGRNTRRLVDVGLGIAMFDWATTGSSTQVEARAQGSDIASVAVSKPSSAEPGPGPWTWDGDPNDPFTHIDGNWEFLGAGNGIRSPQGGVSGYDRLLGLIGPLSQFEITGRVVIDKFNAYDIDNSSSSGSEGGPAIIGLWDGHSDVNYAGTTPYQGFVPLGFMTWPASLHQDGVDGRQLAFNNAFSPAWSETISDPPQFAGAGDPSLDGNDISFRFRVTNDGTNPRFQQRIWPTGSSEPGAWVFDYTDTGNTDNLSGGIVLVAHHAELTWHNITVTKI